MGAWSTGNFENDAALDFLTRLYGHEDGRAVLEEALRPLAAEGTDHLYTGSVCCAALAAAEVVAALGGVPGARLTEEARDWAWYRRPVQPDSLEPLIELAREASRRTASDSELRDLWAGSDSFDEWLAVVEELNSRLERATADDTGAPTLAEKFPEQWNLAVDLDPEQAVGPMEEVLTEYLVFDPAESCLYVASRDHLAAFDLRLGQQRWTSYEAIRPLMILGDVILAQARPAPLHFKHLHLVLLDKETGWPLQKLKLRLDQMLHPDFTCFSGFLRVQVRRGGEGTFYLVWTSGVFPPPEQSWDSSSVEEESATGAVCLDLERKQVRIVPCSEVPKIKYEQTNGEVALDEVIKTIDQTRMICGPWAADDEILAIRRWPSSSSRTPEAPPVTENRPALDAIVVQRWAWTGERREDVTLLHTAAQLVTAWLTVDKRFICVQVDEFVDEPVVRHHIFDTRTHEEVSCFTAGNSLGQLETRLDDVYLFLDGIDGVIRAVDPATGQVLIEQKID